ncbi:putative glutathione S-transferase [Elsinoe ampelina]|uniref:Putative glutathione S-transferase n=1 Tax=Elsinoe ampelina TaxID=302913 RepID=A0A6A6G8Y0_9PEZI|nr:putative glutathione S-transferase [Elsinoe ampelina]
MSCNAPANIVWSQFVTKLEARLRFSNVSYKADCGSLGQSPRKKLPYISIAEEGEEPVTMSDSTLIVKDLIKRGIAEDLNAHLTPSARAQDLAIRALLEDKLVFYQGYERWHENYYTMRDHVMASIPYPIRVVLANIPYRANMRTFYGQGTGRFSSEEIAAFRLEVWESIESLLEESAHRQSKAVDGQPYWILGGSQPTEADTTLFGFISSNLTCTAAPSSQKIIRSKPVVLEYAQRIHDTYFPEYQRWE